MNRSIEQLSSYRSRAFRPMDVDYYLKGLSDGRRDGWLMAIEAIDRVIADSPSELVRDVLTVIRDVMKEEAEKHDDERTHA